MYVDRYYQIKYLGFLFLSALGTKQPFFAKALATQEGNNFQPTIAGCDSGMRAYRSRGLVLFGRAV